MSAKTKIVVFHRKELLNVGIFVAIGVLLLILLFLWLRPNHADTPMEEDVATASQSIYIPGIYTTQLVLGGESIDVEVAVDTTRISSIQLVNLNETVTTMYPLLEPTFDSICSQVYEQQSLDHINYAAENKYTSLVLLDAIRNSLDKASITKQVFLPEYVQ